jgi:hypothetical protein
MLPAVTERWLRVLVKMPRGVFIGQFALGKQQIAAIQRIVEVELDPARFSYFLDGDSVAHVKQAIANNKRRDASRKRLED